MKELPILQIDPLLRPYQGDLALRMENYRTRLAALLPDGRSLSAFADGATYFGFHQQPDGWWYREWAPGADAMYLTGDFNGWDRRACPMTRRAGGVFEVFLSGHDALRHGQRVLAIVQKNGQDLDRIPLYAHYVVQEPETGAWNAVIYAPPVPYQWHDAAFRPQKTLYIYECHIGMAQERPGIGTYDEFRVQVLPRVKRLGYNTIQIMAIMEHPYYASFGYQVTNFFAASSRFGTPDQLKALIDTAHGMGIAVLLDVVHSHAAKNTREGINEFDGTPDQFFYPGPRGTHAAWDTKCFQYGKHEVLHFLLSNLKYWLTEYHFDGFRFDGVTSMLYHDHGLGATFDHYDKYFSPNTNTEAVTYLQLANTLVRQVNPAAITIAEDTSAMPGLCLPVEDGGIGFDYRLAMGIPDLWIRILKERRDEDWDLWNIWYELTGRRPKEPVIAYVESHDQALVGDKTVMFRLCDAEMYWNMAKDKENLVIDRGMALHKMIRLLTLSLGGEGYLTFMGNEFGHPEWIDFPRAGNGWSYQYCRRQWSLADDPTLRYGALGAFDAAMIALARRCRLFRGKSQQLYISNQEGLIVYRRGGTFFAFNFSPQTSYPAFFLPTGRAGTFTVLLNTDRAAFGGQGRISGTQRYEAAPGPDGRIGFPIYLPSRTAIVLREEKG